MKPTPISIAIQAKTPIAMLAAVIDKHTLTENQI